MNVMFTLRMMDHIYEFNFAIKVCEVLNLKGTCSVRIES